MKKNKFRIGWVMALLALVTMACTCGLLSGLGQAGNALQTAQSLATGVATSGILETAQAIATEGENSPYVLTAEALATQVGSGGGGVSFGEAPPDIPVIEDHDQFFGSNDVVTYFTKVDYKTALEFYKKEMPAHEWKEADGSTETDNTAVLYYDKPDRKATVTISAPVGQTTVQILIEPK